MNGRAGVRMQWFGAASADQVVVVLPGLGLPSYVVPTARALARRRLACAVLDIPGFGAGGDAKDLVCAPHIREMGRAAARWCERLSPGRRVVLLGHSTGAQAALGTALDLQERRPDAVLVLAAPTFAPTQRGWGSVARATLTAYRRDSPAEIVVLPEILRGHLDVGRIVASGLRDRPEERIAGLTLPLALEAGRHDTYAPSWWLEQLATAATASPLVTTTVLGGSHNNLFTHPEAVADVVVDLLERSAGGIEGGVGAGR